MVGVPRSTGCLACRKSKLKCDEAKPLCGRCEKTKHACEYPNKYKFVHEASKRTSKEKAEHDSTWPLPAQQQRGFFFYTSEQRTKDGILYQKWHRSGIHTPPTHSPSLSRTETQGYDLIKCWNEGPKGMRFDLCAAWFRQLPSRLGLSTALDDAAAFVANVHRLMLKNQDPSRWLCPVSYIKALRSLRHALLDPKEGYAIETLAAAMILYHVEEKLGDPVCNSIRHAGGIGLLLESRGRIDFQSQFDWELFGQGLGPVISSCVMLGTPCFLTKHSWIQYLESFEPPNEIVALVQEFSVWLVHWPNLAFLVRRLRRGLVTPFEFEAAWTLIHKIRSRLDALEMIIDEHIAQNDDIVLVQAKRVGSPLDKVFEFGNNSAWPALINTHSAYIFILDNMLDFMNQHGRDLGVTISKNSRRHSKAEQHEHLVQKVCRTYEWSTFARPLMAGMAVLALSSAHHYARTCEIQEWILQSLNDGDGHRQISETRYTASLVEFMNKIFIGAVDIPQEFDSSVRVEGNQYNESIEAISDLDLGASNVEERIHL